MSANGKPENMAFACTHRALERRPLLVVEPVELTPESFGGLIRRHRRRLKRREELVVAVEAARTTGRDIG